MPDEARDGLNVALKWQFEVTSHSFSVLDGPRYIPLSPLACLNNFHDSAAHLISYCSFANAA